MKYRTPAAIALAAIAAVACETPDRVRAGAGGAIPAAALGEDGALTVSMQGTVLNAYSALAADVQAGSTSLVVDSAGQLDLAAPMGPLAVGDMLLVIQMQGASVDSSNGPSFGAVTDLGSAGRYELVLVGGVNGNTIDIAAGCGGLRNSYVATAGSQVVRVPQLDSLTVDGAGSVVAMPWDGTRGGVVALHVRGALDVNGGIDASGAGFRGGALDLVSNDSDTDNTTWRSTDATDGAEKGEGIAGFGAAYDALGGRFGRAPAANGGGGGTAHNGGGGGGANASNGAAWTGMGVMDAGTTGAAAWTLDPAYAANGNSLTASSGGGRGGYTFSSDDQDALTVPPGDPAWGGNTRRERGGRGGRPLDEPIAERLFLGGGGGAGDSNNGAGGTGGRGGGIVLLVAGSVAGNGAIRADGADGTNTIPTHNDGPGGGGAGGTIVVEAAAIEGVTLSADGGNGGDQLITNDEAEGPGGGGGGGRIAITAGVPSRSALGGSNGTTTSDSVTEFPANGATRGAGGREDEEIPLGALPACRPVDVFVTKDDGRTEVRRGGRTVYVIEVSLDSDAAGASGIVVQDPLPPGVRAADWTCDATPGSACADASGSGPIDTTVDLVGGGVATFTVDARLDRDAPDVLENMVTASVPTGFVDADPGNDIATDANDVLAEYGVAGSGCGCRTTDARGGGSAAASLVIAAGLTAAAVRRRRRLA